MAAKSGRLAARGAEDLTAEATQDLPLGIERYRAIRDASTALCAPLSDEDCVVQSMPDASPAKWHLAHTTWFFETFVLPQSVPGYRCFDPDYPYLFNSYYNTVGPMHPRSQRGMLTRPPLSDVRAYREHVDELMSELLDTSELDDDIGSVVEIGLQHEQQHQELMIADIKHAFSCNPVRPAYRAAGRRKARAVGPLSWREYPEGLRRVGTSDDGFAYDNERPSHRVFLDAFKLASRPVTAGEFMEFIDDDGYRRSELWLSDGWNMAQHDRWQAPLYWERSDGTWHEFTLAGMRAVDVAAPVCHVSYYEAEAYARWAGARLPTEAEWEIAAASHGVSGNLLENAHGHPQPAGVSAGAGLQQIYGDVWEWTASPYTPYPGYRAPAGALGEYNGKFMSNQMVLRGGSCATPRTHVRATYRNFFFPHQRWQFSGLRLARNAR